MSPSRVVTAIAEVGSRHLDDARASHDALADPLPLVRDTSSPSRLFRELIQPTLTAVPLDVAGSSR